MRIEVKKYFRRKNNCNEITETGFSLIEVMMAISIFAIGFMAITSSVIAGSKSGRATVLADQALLWGQQITENLAAIPLDAPDLEGGDSRIIERECRKAEIFVFDAVDQDGNGRDDYKTVGLKVWVKQGNAFALRMENYYRRSARQ